MKQRYMELRNLVHTRRYDDARRLVLRFDEEDDDVPEGTYADEVRNERQRVADDGGAPDRVSLAT